MLGKGQNNWWHRKEAGDLAILNDSKCLFQIKTGKSDNGGAPGKEFVHKNLHAVNMEEWKNGEHHFSIGYFQSVFALHKVCNQIAVSEHHALW